MIAGLCPDVEQSAKQTLQSLAKAFGAEKVGSSSRRGERCTRDEESDGSYDRLFTIPCPGLFLPSRGSPLRGFSPF
jgi:hypothetical protein